MTGMSAGSEQDVLLATKLHVPGTRPGFVPRARLADRLEEGLDRKLVLVSAPAGSGKTALLADWARHNRRPVAWLSLDPGDNDPVRFWRHAAAALDQVCPGIAAKVAALLGPPAPRSFRGVVTAVINEIAAQPAGEEILLFLDDYNLIGSLRVHESMTFLIEHLPPGLHLMLASRADPPLGLARLRAGAQLAELRAADLRFTPGEAAALLSRAAGEELPDAATAALTSRTEGWAAGLQLAGLSLRGRSDISGFVAAFDGSHRYVLDYLTGEVLDHQPGDVRAFLLETSVLERLSGALCDVVTGRGDGQAMLEEIERANLFLVPLDEVRGWWRYHHLFADLLRKRLQRERPGRAPQLRRAAAIWCEEHGLADEAIGYALASDDPLLAAQLIERHFDAFFYSRAEGPMVQRWLAALPVSLVAARPRLLLIKAAIALLSGRMDEVTALLDNAERSYADAATEPFEPSAGKAASFLVNIPARIALDRAYLADLRGDGEEHRDVRDPGTCRDPRGQDDAQVPRRRDPGHGRLAARPPPRGRARLRVQHHRVARPGPPWPSRHGVHRHSARSSELQGRLGAALRTYRLAAAITADVQQAVAPTAGTGNVGLAEIAYARGDLDAARRHVTESITRNRGARLHTAAGHRPGPARVDQAGRGGPGRGHRSMGEAARLAPDPGITSLLEPRVRRTAGCCWPRATWPRPAAGSRSAACPPTTNWPIPGRPSTSCWPACSSRRACPAGHSRCWSGCTPQPSARAGWGAHRDRDTAGPGPRRHR